MADATLVFGWVAGRYIKPVATTDGPDSDTLPDAVPVAGSIIFDREDVGTSVLSPAVAGVVQDQTVCVLDADGYLTDPDGTKGVRLVPGAYIVTYRLDDAERQSHEILVLDTHTSDFPLQLPDASPGGGAPVTPSDFAILSARISAGFEESDSSVAGFINTPDSATQTALNSTYDPLALTVKAAPRVVVIGCSIENLYSYRNVGAASSTEQYGRDWPTFAAALSSGRFNMVRNMGTGGETTTQYLARFDTDVLPSLGSASAQRGNAVFIGGAENDIQQSIPIATTRANIVEMVRRTRAAGATPMLRTTMPHFLSNAIRQSVGAFNQWVRNYGAEAGILVFDFWRQVVDPATGQYLAAYSADGVHPNELGSKLLGQHVADTLSGVIPAVTTQLASDPTDTGLLAPARLFLTDTSGTPTGWNAIGGTPAGATRSMVTAAGVPGRLARLTAAATVAGFSISNNSGAITNGTHAVAGDVLEVCGLVTSTGGAPVSVTISILYNDGIVKNMGRIPISLITVPLNNAQYFVRMPPLPGGFLYISMTLGIGPGTGTVDFSYPSVRNLTREGIAS